MAATVLQFRAATSDESVTCYKCGVEFASPVIVRRRRDGENFWCPNGHSQAFFETEAAKLRKQLEEEQRKRQQAENSAAWAKASERSARVAEGIAKAKLKKVETRVNAGVCPHCNRTFQQLARHMQCKHAPEQQGSGKVKQA